MSVQRATHVDLSVELEPGLELGQRIVPVDSVGVYVPGGRYQLIASALVGSFLKTLTYEQLSPDAARGVALAVAHAVDERSEAVGEALRRWKEPA